MIAACLTALRDLGLWVGIACNQTSRAGEILPKLALPADLIATSEDWGGEQTGRVILSRTDIRHAV